MREPGSWCGTHRYALVSPVATSEAVTGDREEACSTGGVGDRTACLPATAADDVSGDVYEEMRAWLCSWYVS